MLIRKVISKLAYLQQKRKAKYILRELGASGGNLCLSNNAKITVNAQGPHEVAIGKNVTLWNGVKISVCTTGNIPTHLSIGDNVSIGDRTELHVGDNLSIGDGTLIAWDCCIMDRDYHKINSMQEKTAPVIIGKDVWIGCNSLILKGVTIGEGSVVAAGSVVTHDVLPHSLVAGNPAKVIRENVQWKP